MDRSSMSGPKNKRPALVADKSKPAASRRTRAKPRKTKQKRSGNPVTWLFRLITRLVWGIGWRVTALVTIVWYSHSSLPLLSL